MMLIIYIALGIALAPYILQIIVVLFAGIVFFIGWLFKKLKNPVSVILNILLIPFKIIKYLLDGVDKISKTEIKWRYLFIILAIFLSFLVMAEL